MNALSVTGPVAIAGMPPKLKTVNNRPITDFFKKFTGKRFGDDEIGENITVACSRSRTPADRVSPTSERAKQHITDSQSPRKEHGTQEERVLASSSCLSTPPTYLSSPDFTPRRRTGAADESRQDDSVVHISPPSAQKREVMAIEIPFPTREANKTKPQATSESLPPTTTVTSFSSFSTLSSVPPSTQGSSRRIFKHGMQAVTNSDDSTDSGGEELPDVWTFIPRKRVKMTPPEWCKDNATEIPSTAKPGRRSARLSDQSNTTSGARTLRLPPFPPRAVYKHSLLKLVTQREKQERTEAHFREVDEAFEEAQKRREQEFAERAQDLDGELKVAVEGDSDDGERVRLAMARTEAAQGEGLFCYFRGLQSTMEDTSFPSDDLGDWKCADKIKDPEWRAQTCLSGFLAELSSRYGLPEAVQHWMERQLVHEEREDLCDAYVNVLCSAKYLDYSGVGNLDCIYMTAAPESPSHLRRYADLTEPPPGLAHVIQVLQHYSVSLGMDYVANAVVSLMFANIDSHVVKDPSLRSTIYEAIETLLSGLDDAEFGWVCSEIGKGFFGKQCFALRTQYCAVSSFPCYSERTHELRRRLALRLISGNELSKPMSSADFLDLLKAHPDLSISDFTDYAQLNGLIAVLDIAIDAGFSDHVFVASQPKEPRITGLFTKARPISAAHKDFNAQIDILTKYLRLLGNRIQGRGTTQLNRTEAKSALERLVFRLEYSVRTRPKPTNNVFGGGLGEDKASLNGFLKQGNVKKQEGEGECKPEVKMEDFENLELKIKMEDVSERQPEIKTEGQGERKAEIKKEGARKEGDTVEVDSGDTTGDQGHRQDAKAGAENS